MIIGVAGFIATVLAVALFFNTRARWNSIEWSRRNICHRQRVLQDKSILPGWGAVGRRLRERLDDLVQKYELVTEDAVGSTNGKDYGKAQKV